MVHASRSRTSSASGAIEAAGVEGQENRTVFLAMNQEADDLSSSDIRGKDPFRTSVSARRWRMGSTSRR